VATVSGPLFFNRDDWNIPQIVTVTGVNDDTINDPNRTTMVAHRASGGGYDDVVVPGVRVTATDNDVPGMTLSTPTLAVGEAGGTGTYTVVLNTPPIGNVTVTPTSGDRNVARVSPHLLTFTTANWNLTFDATNWNVAQTVTVTGVDDNNPGSRTARVTHGVTGGGYDGVTVEAVTVRAVDDEGVGVTLSAATIAVAENGGIGNYTVVLDTLPTGDVVVTPVSSDETVATVSGALTFTPSNWNEPQTVTVTGVDDPIDNDSGRTVFIGHRVSSTAGSAYDGVGVADVRVTATDDDTAGLFVAKQVISLGEVSPQPQEGEYTVRLNSKPTASVKVIPESEEPMKVTVVPTELTFTPTNWDLHQTVTVRVVDDNIDNPADQVFINHRLESEDGNYNGPSGTKATISIQDNDTAGVTVPDGNGDRGG